MEERNRLVLEAASMLRQAHAVDDAAVAHGMAQDGLVRRLRRGDDRRVGGGGRGGGRGGGGGKNTMIHLV